MNGVNLHALVRGAITALHPDVRVVVLLPEPYTVNDAYEQEPQYRPPVAVQAQSQPVPESSLMHVQAQRENSVWRDFYFFGLVPGLSRADEFGGSLIYWAGYEWLVEQVLEDWASGTDGVNWCKVRAIRQGKADAPEVAA